ncbi:MAG: hypothetical protein QUV06_04980 [Cyanobium sp. CZS 48M]|nr:hypothetical protein [Cyanobium sp. CZS48M]
MAAAAAGLSEENADPAVRVHLVVLAEEGDYTEALLDDMQRLRLGQGLFRHRVSELEPACRVTGLARLRQQRTVERIQWPAALPPY